MDRSAAKARVTEIVRQFNNNRKSKCLSPFPQLPEGESYGKNIEKSCFIIKKCVKTRLGCLKLPPSLSGWQV